MKELQIGEVIEHCKISLQCIKSDGSCDGCYFSNVRDLYCDCDHRIFGSCNSFNRDDNNDVIFVKVGEVKSVKSMIK